MANTSERIDWSRKSLDELESTYWGPIATAMEADGMDPTTERPSYRWLADHGFSGIAYALREHHGLTPKEFFVDVVGVGENDSEGYDWGIEHETTVRLLESYLRSVQSRGETVAEATAETRRSRLGRWVRTYRDTHDRHDLVSPLAGPDERPAEIDRAWAVLDVLDAELSTSASKLEYLRVARNWYAHLHDRGRAQYNPLATAGNVFDWERDPPDNPALDASQVRGLVETAGDLADRLLVVGLAGWGLRPSELASLHVSQANLEAEDPHLAFEERKNGPGTVALIYGLDVLADRVDQLDTRADWNGYLFPSRAATSGHIAVTTVARRFKRLAREAGVTVRGDVPTPKYGRRFWYATYQDAVAELAERTSAIAEDQGSADAEVVLRNYLSEDKRRDLRRETMRERLAAAFEPIEDTSSDADPYPSKG